MSFLATATYVTNPVIRTVKTRLTTPVPIPNPPLLAGTPIQSANVAPSGHVII